MAHTIKDVSNLAGVSTATVSRTFSNPGTVSEATREKVFEAARMLNYQPNAIARSMKLQQTEKIAFIICKESGSILDEFYAGICNGIMQEMNETDYQLLVSTERDWTFGKRSQVDGVILGSNASLQLIRDCIRQGVRIVLVNNEIEGFHYPTVISDERMAIDLAVSHLIARGHKKIAMLAGRFSPYICEQRLSAFKEIMAERKLPVPAGYIMITDPDIKSSTEIAMAMLSQPDPPTAIMAANDEIATGAYKAAIRMGLRIPQDIAIVGIDDSRICKALEPELTSVKIDCDKMGRAAARMMIYILGDAGKNKGAAGRAENGGDTAGRLVLQPELNIRNST